jgi:hypothetical protein
MVWDKVDLKNAFDHSTAFLELVEAKRNTISQRFDDVYNRLPQNVRNAANPVSIARAFDEAQTEIRTPNAAAGGTRFFGGSSQCSTDATTHARSSSLPCAMFLRRSLGSAVRSSPATSDKIEYDRRSRA